MVHIYCFGFVIFFVIYSACLVERHDDRWFVMKDMFAVYKFSLIATAVAFYENHGFELKYLLLTPFLAFVSMFVATILYGVIANRVDTLVARRKEKKATSMATDSATMADSVDLTTTYVMFIPTNNTNTKHNTTPH